MNTRWICMVSLLLGGAAAQAGPAATTTESIPLDDAKSVLVQVDFGLGEFDLGKAGEGVLFDGRFTSDPDEVEARVDYRRRRDQGVLHLATDYDSEQIRGHFKNKWTVGLAAGLPLELELDLGATEARIDLSGLSVTSLQLDLGAADCEVWWDEPNGEVLSELAVDCGASSLQMSGLGDARFERMKFEGGLGSFDLDFSGAWTHSAEADLEIGLGELTLRFPEHIGVRIEVEEAMASVKVDRNFSRVGDDLWESRNYDSAPFKLVCFVQLGMGSLSVKSVSASAP